MRSHPPVAAGALVLLAVGLVLLALARGPRSTPPSAGEVDVTAPEQPQPVQRRQHPPRPAATARPPPPNAAPLASAVQDTAGDGDALEAALWKQVVEADCRVDFTATIETQLAPFLTAGITQQQLDELYCIRKNVARVSVHNGVIRQENWQLSLDHNRLRSGMYLLHLAVLRARLRGRPVPDVELVVNPTDKTANFASGKQRSNKDGDRLRRTPLLCNVKCTDDAGISFPFYYHPLFGLPDGTMSLRRYADNHRDLVRIGTGASWDAKRPKAFFSAKNTRGHRARMFALDTPHLETRRGNVPLPTYGDYRYSVYTYGHSGWSARLRELMFFNTTVLLERSKCSEFILHTFKAGTDYIPVAEDLSDLPDVLAAAAADSDGSRAMAMRWVAKGRDLLRMECLLEYIAELLRAYAKLQHFTPQPRPTWGEHRLNSTLHYFLDARPPRVDTCRPYF